MDLGNLLLIVLRLIHIMAAVTWFGMALVTFRFLIPADTLAGEAGLRFMKVFYTRTSIASIFPVVSVTTVIAGILLYITGSASHFTQPGNIILGIGAVAGLAAAGHGGMATGKYTGLYAAALAKNLPDGQTPSAEGLAEINATREKYILHVRLSFIMVVIALVFMASARYF